MPTGAKLFSAVAFAILGWLAAAVLAQGLPQSVTIGRVPEGAGLAGLVAGWTVMGASVGRGFGAAIGTGLRTGFVMAVVVLAGVSVWEMLEAALRRAYRGPFEAVMGVFDQVLYYGAMLGDVPFLTVLAAGSALAGLLAEVAGRRWS